MKKIHIIIILLATFFSSCVVTRPDSNSIGTADYNKRVEVREAHYDRVLSPIGVGSIAVGSLAGAYAGYRSDMFTYNEGANRKQFSIGGALVGATLGFVATKYVNHIFGWGNVKTPANPNEWIYKTNNEYLLLSQYSNTDFNLIHKSAELSYASKNIQDARDFAKVFPKSKNETSVVIQSGKVVSRSEIPELIGLFPTNPKNIDIKYRYLNLSSDIAECIEAKNRFPVIDTAAETLSLKYITSFSDVDEFEKNWESSRYNEIVGYKYLDYCSTVSNCVSAKERYSFLTQDAETKAVSLLSGLEDIKNFNRSWQSSKYTNNVIEKSISICERHQLPQIISLFSNYNTQNVKIAYISNSPSIVEFLRAIDNYPITAISISPNSEYRSLESARNLYDEIRNHSSVLGATNITQICNSLKDYFLYNEFDRIKNDSLQVQYQFQSMISSETWLDAGNRKSPDGSTSINYHKQIAQSITDLQNYLAVQQRIREYEEAKQNGMDALIGFCNKYPNTTQAAEAAKAIEHYVKSHLELVKTEAWFVRGDRNWVDDFYEESRDLISGGGRYNYIRVGLVKNNSDQVINMKISATFKASYLCGISFLRSTSVETSTDYEFLKIYPHQEYPFVLFFKNISEGTNLGSGLLSAGCSFIDYDVDYSLDYYPNTIDENILNEQESLLRQILANGNVKTTLSPSENTVKWLDDMFGTTSSGSTLRVYFNKKDDIEYSVTVSSNGNTIDDESVTSEGSKTVDFSVPSNNYYTVTIPDYGTYTVLVKGRLTHLIISDKGLQTTDYQDID